MCVRVLALYFLWCKSVKPYNISEFKLEFNLAPKKSKTHRRWIFFWNFNLISYLFLSLQKPCMNTVVEMTKRHWSCLVQSLMPVTARYDHLVPICVCVLHNPCLFLFTYWIFLKYEFYLYLDDRGVWWTTWCIQWSLVQYVAEYWTSCEG